MKWRPANSIARIVRRQQPTLDEVFGGDAYQVLDMAQDCCIVQSSLAVATLAYSRRDRWAESSIRFRDLPEDIPTDTLRFLGGEAPMRKGEPLSERPVKEELYRVMRVCEAFRDHPDLAQEALVFFNRECEEYTRRYDGTL
jgi:hypothetical protein